MTELENAMEDFLAYEDVLNNYIKSGEKLQHTYKHALQIHLVGGLYEASGAKLIYEAYKAIQDNEQKINEHKERLKDKELIIKKYLTATNGIPISYIKPSNNSYAPAGRIYIFILNEENRVVHRFPGY